MGPSGRVRSRLHDQAWHYLLGLGPDLAFLQETLPPAWVRGEGTLLHGPFKQWGSVIFSPRFPLERFRLPDDSNLRALGSYLAFGVASLPDGSDAFLASVHARAGDATRAQLGALDADVVRRPSARVPRVNDVVSAGLERLAGDRFIVAGDWNTAREQGSDAKSKLGREFFDRAHDRGWYDCVWDKLHREERTWFGGGDHVRQDDHVFCDGALGGKLEKVRAAEEAATHLALSDHAPLVLDFKVDPIAMTSLSEATGTPLTEDEPA